MTTGYSRTFMLIEHLSLYLQSQLKPIIPTYYYVNNLFDSNNLLYDIFVCFLKEKHYINQMI